MSQCSQFRCMSSLTLNLMNNPTSVSNTWSQIWAGPFRWIVLSAVIVGLGRYIELFFRQEWLTAATFSFLFWLGATAAAVFWTLSPWWLHQLQQLGLRFSTRPDYSPLRTPLLFFVLPILGVFLVSSSRAPFGLGFLWSLSIWYAFEAVQLLQQNQAYVRSYFADVTQLRAEGIQTLLWGQVVYALLITVGLLVI